MLRILYKLKRWWNPPPEPAHGPRRLKNYASETGFHYQYHLESSEPGDYRFAIWTAGQPRREMRVKVPLESLSARDRYALAKLRLFQAFDQLAPDELPCDFEVKDTTALDGLIR